MSEDYEIGTRVHIDPERADGFILPWRNRIKRGLYGIITGRDSWGYHVRFDMPKQAKHPHDWLWQSVRHKDLIRTPK